MTEKTTFYIKDPMYGEDTPKYVPVTCEVVDEGNVLECKVEEVTVRITPIRVRITREPIRAGRTLSVEGKYWGEFDFVRFSALELVDVEWLR